MSPSSSRFQGPISTTCGEDQVYWTLPLPYDIVYLLVATYLEDSSATICTLSLTCKPLAEICRPLKFRAVVLRIPQHKCDYGTLTHFLALLTASPNIIDFIGHLTIADGRGGLVPWAEPKPYDLVPLEHAVSSLLFIFNAHDLRNLKRLTISLKLDWSSLPTELLRTFAYIFARPNICAVTIEKGVSFPTPFLHLLNEISSLEIFGVLDQSTAVPTVITNQSTPKTRPSHCAPEKLVLKDDSRSGINLLILLPSPRTPFHLSRLTELRVFLKGPHISILNDIIGSCSKTLTTLGVYVATWGGLPAALNLQDLTALKSLTLTVDAEMMPYGRMTGTEAPARLNWFLTALETCKIPNAKLDTIGLVLRARSLQEAHKLPWSRIDDLFAARLSTSWTNLRAFDVLIVEEDTKLTDSISEDLLKQALDPLLPCIAKVDVLRVRRSTERMEFWRM